MEKQDTDVRKLSRLGYIDAARGVAIIFVILGHFPNEIIGEDFKQWIYSFHIPVFFIITGVLFAKNIWRKNERIYVMIKRRAQKLLIPYFCYSLVSLAYVAIAWGKNAIVKYIIWSLLFVGIGTLWFLPAIFLAETFFVLINSNKNIRIWGSILMCGASLLFSRLEFLQIENRILFSLCLVVNVISCSFMGCTFITIGYYLEKINNKINLEKWECTIVGCISLVINLVLYKYNIVDFHYSVFGRPLIFFVNSVLGSIAVLCFSRFFLHKIKILKYAGKNSLILCSTHINFGVLTLAELIGKKIFDNRWAVLVSMIVIVFLFEIVISEGIEFILKRIKG